MIFDLILATETGPEKTNLTTQDIILIIVFLIASIIAGIIVFFVVRKKMKRSNEYRTKYYDNIANYVNNKKKNDYPISEIRTNAQIEQDVDDSTLANLFIELSNSNRLYRKFNYRNGNFHAIDSELDNYPDRLNLENTASKAFRIGVNKETKKVVFIVNDNFTEYDFNEIMAYEIYKQDKEILHGETKKSKKGAIVGGALFGEAGSIAGAMAGNSETTQTTQEYVDKFMLYIKTTRLSDPIFTVHIIDKRIETNSSKYMKILEDSKRLSAVLDYIILVNDSETQE